MSGPHDDGLDAVAAHQSLIPASRFIHGAWHKPLLGPAETATGTHSQKLSLDLVLDQPVADLIRDGVAPSTRRA